MLFERADIVSDLAPIAAVRYGFTPQFAWHVKESATQDLGIFLPGRPSGNGVMHEYHTLASFQQRQQIGFVQFTRNFEIRPPTIKPDAGMSYITSAS